jgi:hypothetical protein
MMFNVWNFGHCEFCTRISNFSRISKHFCRNCLEMHISADICSTNGIFASRAEVLTVYYFHGAGIVTAFTINMVVKWQLLEPNDYRTFNKTCY